MILKVNKIINDNYNINYIDDKINKEEKLNNEINKNIQLNYRIKELEIELNNEKEKNNKLSEQIKKYKQIIKELNDKISGIKSIDKNKLLELQNIVKEKANEINILISNLSDSKVSNIQSEEKTIAIGFASVDQNVQNFFRACKDSDLFVKLEIELYDEYPKYKDVETYFLVEGRKIFRFKSIKENNIKNGQILMLNFVK